MAKRPDVIVEVNEYIGVFLKRTANGRFRRIWQCGNAGVSLDVVELLRKLGHVVRVDESSVEQVNG